MGEWVTLKAAGRDVFPCVTFSVCFYPRKSTTNPTDTKVRFQVESKIITPPKMSLSLQCWKSRSVIIGEIKSANQLWPENGSVTAAADLTEENEPTDGRHTAPASRRASPSRAESFLSPLNKKLFKNFICILVVFIPPHTSSQVHPFPTHPTLCSPIFPFKSSALICVTCILLCVCRHWSVADPAETTALKRSSFLFRYQ